jgi:hypothetical protein
MLCATSSYANTNAPMDAGAAPLENAAAVNADSASNGVSMSVATGYAEADQLLGEPAPEPSPPDDAYAAGDDDAIGTLDAPTAAPTWQEWPAHDRPYDYSLWQQDYWAVLSTSWTSAYWWHYMYAVTQGGYSDADWQALETSQPVEFETMMQWQAVWQEHGPPELSGAPQYTPEAFLSSGVGEADGVDMATGDEQAAIEQVAADTYAATGAATPDGEAAEEAAYAETGGSAPYEAPVNTTDGRRETSGHEAEPSGLDDFTVVGYAAGSSYDMAAAAGFGSYAPRQDRDAGSHNGGYAATGYAAVPWGPQAESREGEASASGAQHGAESDDPNQAQLGEAPGTLLGPGHLTAPVDAVYSGSAPNGAAELHARERDDTANTEVSLAQMHTQATRVLFTDEDYSGAQSPPLSLPGVCALCSQSCWCRTRLLPDLHVCLCVAAHVKYFHPPLLDTTSTPGAQAPSRLAVCVGH